MTQQQLDRAVARATGESVHTIRNLGFSPLWIPQSVNEMKGPTHGHTLRKKRGKGKAGRQPR